MAAAAEVGKRYTGVKLQISKGTRGDLSAALDVLEANSWYEIQAIGGTEAVPLTALPAGMSLTGFFKTPDAGETPTTLLAGDAVYPYTLNIVCKTDGELSAEEGVVDVTTDCDGGYIVNILDGLVALSGSINGFLMFDEATDELITDSKELLSRFFDSVTDDSTGVYTVTPKSNEKIILFILLNKSAKLAEVQNYLIIPVNITTLGTGAGLTDAQKSDVNWSKSEGVASNYLRTVAAGDL